MRIWWPSPLPTILYTATYTAQAHTTDVVNTGETIDTRTVIA
jgi:hypothetical protein